MLPYSLTALFKADAAKRQVSGIVYREGVVDSQGEMVLGDALEKMAHAALARGIRIVIGHDSTDPVGQVIESAILDGELGKEWFVAAQITSDDAWSKIDSKALAAFSMGGRAVRKDWTFHGRPVRLLTDATIDHIALVRTGANREQFIAKTQAPTYVGADGRQFRVRAVNGGWIHAAVAAAEAEESKRLAEVEDPQTVQKAALEKAHADAEAHRIVRAEELRRFLKSAHDRLFELVGVDHLPDARERERDLVREIAKVETELERLVPSLSPLNDPRHDAFRQNGGTSQILRADQLFPGGDSAFQRRPDRVRKQEREIDLSCLRI